MTLVYLQYLPRENKLPALGLSSVMPPFLGPGRSLSKSLQHRGRDRRPKRDRSIGPAAPRLPGDSGIGRATRGAVPQPPPGLAGPAWKRARMVHGAGSGMSSKDPAFTPAPGPLDQRLG